MDPEAALGKLGNPWTSRWTMCTLALIVVMRGMCSSWHCTAVVFLGAETSHHCRLPDGVSVNQSIPLVRDSSGRLAYDKCHVYVNYTAANNKTEQCQDGWEYDMSMHTIVHEWDLVCDKDYYPDMWQSSFIAGTMLGAAFQGVVIDKMGRKAVFLFSVLVLSCLTFVSAWVTNFYVFVGIKFGSGILMQGLGVASLVLACEMFQSNQRTVACTAINCGYGLGMLVYALMAFYLPEWRHLVIAMAIPIVFIIPGCFIIQESIPWLMATNQVDRVNTILQKVAKWNGRELKDTSTDSKNLLPSPQLVHVEKGAPGPEYAADQVVAPPLSSPPPLGKHFYPNLLRETLLKEASQSLPELAIPIKNDRSPQEECLDTFDTLSSMPALNGVIPKTEKKRYLHLDVTASIDSLHISTMNVYRAEESVIVTKEGIRSVTSLNKDNGDEVEGQKSQYLALLLSPRYRMCTLIISYSLFAVSLGYHGLSLAVGTLAGNIYANYAMMGLVEIPSYILLAVISRCFGRKSILCCCFLMGGLLLWLSLIVFHLAEPDIAGLASTVLSMMGKFFLSMAFGLLPQYAIELFPTTVRSQALGIIFFIGKMGSTAAPFSSYLGKVIIWMPSLIFGSVTVSAGMLILLLPETRGQPLLQSIEEAELYYAEQERKKKELKAQKEKNREAKQELDTHTKPL